MTANKKKNETNFEPELKEKPEINENETQVADEITNQVNELVDEIQLLHTELESYKDKYLRAVAELDNFRKRIDRKIQDERQALTTEYLGIIFDAIDDLTRVEKAMPVSTELESFIKAIELVKNKLHDKLKLYNIIEIASLGNKFNPNQHEVLMEMEKEHAEPGEIIEVYAAGYMIDERPLRTAKVIIAKKPADSNKTDSNVN